MKTIILKFGGTILDDSCKRKNIIKIIKTYQKKYKVVVVVSALGRYPNPYATDSLLGILSDNSKPYIKDLISSCGEVISSCFVADYLNNNGIDSYPVTAYNINLETDDKYNDASFIKMDKTFIENLLEKNIVPIITGFQGINNNKVTTLGRGGSDTTATILGNILNANKIIIFKDVDGILTEDPKKNKKAKTYKKLSYNEAYELANNGARVLHSKSILYAKEKNIPIIVKNIDLSHEEETIIN